MRAYTRAPNAPTRNTIHFPARICVEQLTRVGLWIPRSRVRLVLVLAHVRIAVHEKVMYFVANSAFLSKVPFAGASHFPKAPLAVCGAVPVGGMLDVCVHVAQLGPTERC
jgi:hypothetical protein